MDRPNHSSFFEIFREEVNIAKQIDRETVTVTDTLRHEKLDLNTQRQPNINPKSQPDPNNGSAKK